MVRRRELLQAAAGADMTVVGGRIVHRTQNKRG
jgi:hypothetical protein